MKLKEIIKESDNLEDIINMSISNNKDFELIKYFHSVSKTKENLTETWNDYLTYFQAYRQIKKPINEARYSAVQDILENTFDEYMKRRFK